MKLYQIAGSVAVAALLGISGSASAQSAIGGGTAPDQVTFSVVLPMRNAAALKTLTAAQTTVGSPSYHQWLSPAQAAAQFGPDPAVVAQVSSALTAAGFTVTGQHLFALDVAGTSAQVATALKTTLVSVPTSGGDTRLVASGRVVLPTYLSSVGAQVLAFAKLPENKTRSNVLGAAPDNRNGAYGSYNYNDMKEAYDYPSFASANGTGAHVAILMENTAKQTDVTAMFTHENYLTNSGGKPIPVFTQYFTQDCYTKSAAPNKGTNPPAGLYTTTPTGYKISSGCGFNANAGSVEASLDVQQVTGGAPGASVALVTVPSLADQQIQDGYIDIISLADPTNNTKAYFHIVSSSFGGCELFYTAAYNNGYDFTGVLAFYDEIFAVGNSEGITFIASSGDEDGLECPSTAIVPDFIGQHFTSAFIPSVSDPSDDPNVTSVGGGNLQTSFTVAGALPSTYVSENGFGDQEVNTQDPYGLGSPITGGYWGAGGGVSQIWARPAWQTNTPSATARTQPDVGMQVGGCPGGISVTPCHAGDSAVVVTVSGTREGVIGTSVSAPEFAGALSLKVGLSGPQGNLNPFLYTQAAAQLAAQKLAGGAAPAAKQFYHNNIPGFNGVVTYTANANGAGAYNYIYGNGSPDVRNLFGLTAFPAAGTPQTASNP